jgi:ABC-type glycerol-3-phosphate transport system substrate-binding protein
MRVVHFPHRTLRASAIAALLALAACGGKDQVEAVAAAPVMASDAAEVKVGGVAFTADLQPTATGSSLTISRANPPMTYDEGALAKQVAAQFCAGRGKRLAPWSMGQFIGTGWSFNGGCA